MSFAPAVRVRQLGGDTVNRGGDYVLYWMIAARRTTWSYGLDQAIAWATELSQPLLVLEPLRIGYRWASDRLHRFVADGMADNAERLAKAGVASFPYIERREGDGKGLLAALAARASLVVTDDFPAFFYPRMLASAATQVRVRFEAVDSCGLLPLRAVDAACKTAQQFRRSLHALLPEHHLNGPVPDPLRRLRLPRLDSFPQEVVRRWRPIEPGGLRSGSLDLTALAIDHSVLPTGLAGGPKAARRALMRFLSERLRGYADRRNEPDLDATSGLSPYLHFGQIGPHEIVHEVLQREGWSPDRVNPRARGRRAGWWGVSGDGESFLDELVTWRELGFNTCARFPDYDRYDTLPEWARATLAKHAKDPRPYLYALEELESARTHDPLWNAAQRQLVREGRIHNYLRMLWGKKILEWSASAEEALGVMIELNNKYALDGRDPNSYSGISWVLGRYDRPWGPERPVFGTVRYMSSENTGRKYEIAGYLRKYAEG